MQNEAIENGGDTEAEITMQSVIAEADFEPQTIRDGLMWDLTGPENPYPVQVYGWRGAILALPDNATHFGMAVAGGFAATRGGDTNQGFPTEVRSEMFCVLPGQVTITGRADAPGTALFISIPGYHGLFQIGGPLEATGRLRYIDGCTDTLLVSPPRQGEPCLNHLHIPPHTAQTRHTHPSERIGVILRGRGECRTPHGTYPLTPGLAWRIPPGCLHSFYTDEDALDVIAWHPDSDFGPTDDDHPMKNRTFVTTGVATE